MNKNSDTATDIITHFRKQFNSKTVAFMNSLQNFFTGFFTMLWQVTNHGSAARTQTINCFFNHNKHRSFGFEATTFSATAEFSIYKKWDMTELTCKAILSSE